MQDLYKLVLRKGSVLKLGIRLTSFKEHDPNKYPDVLQV